MRCHYILRQAGAGNAILLTLLCSLLYVQQAAANDAITADPAQQPFEAAMKLPSAIAAYESYLDHDAVLDDADAQPYGYPWQGPLPEQPDWPGLRRDAAYFLGYQLITVAALYAAPESISGWDSDDKNSTSFREWKDNVTHPQMDHDKWWINYILHPYWGGAYYIRGRERGLDKIQSFWNSALLSTMFEYGAEAFFEEVSIQDVIVTPVVGSLVGEYLFTPWRESIRAKDGKLTWSDKALLFVTDPLGVVNAQADRLLGVKTSLQFQPIAMQPPAHSAGMGFSHVNPPGYNRAMAPVWGLQLSMDW